MDPSKEVYLCCITTGFIYSQEIMPPFGNESGEKTSRPLGFLSFRNASTPKSATEIFGPERAEAEAKGRSVKRPFSDELDDGQSSEVKQETTSLKQTMVFGDEESEDSDTCNTPFGKEYGESGENDDQCSTSSNDENDFQPKESVFAFGWSSVVTFQKATFWKENMNDENAKPKRRAYDNSKRSAKAAYTREGSRGHFKKNGLSPERLQKLFQAHSCACAFGCKNL